MWNLFNKSADRFFAEKKDKIKNEIIVIKDLNSKLKKEEISISEINESLKEIIHAKNSNEYKKLPFLSNIIIKKIILGLKCHFKMLKPLLLYKYWFDFDVFFNCIFSKFIFFNSLKQIFFIRNF